MKATVKQIADFYERYPEYKNRIEVQTRFGYKSIEEAAVTAPNETVFEMKTVKGLILKCSRRHKVFSNGEFVFVNKLNPGDTVLTKDGDDEVLYVREKSIKKDLYDLQVAEVKEYYTNGIVSHNSTIQDALNFAIFGDTIRPIPKANIINNITNKGAEVTLEFDISEDNQLKSYKILRKLKPSKCYIYEGGNDITESTIKNTDKRISTLLKATPDLFKNCVLMSLNSTLPFMAQNKQEKKKFIEGLLNLGVFSQMLQVARTDKTEADKSFQLISKDHDNEKKLKTLVKERLQDTESFAEKEKKRITDEISFQTTKKTDVVSKIKVVNKENVKKSKDKITELNTFLENITKEVESLSVENTEYMTEGKLEKANLEKIGTDESKCPVCLHEITEDDKDHIDNEKKKLESKLEDLRNKIRSNKEKISELKDKEKGYYDDREKYKKYIEKQKSIENNNKFYETQKKDIDSRLKDLEKQLLSVTGDTKKIETLKSDLGKHDSKITQLDQKLTDTNKEIKVLEYVKHILSEEGVKSFIVKKILAILNNRMLHYLQKMDANCVCKFNEFFEEEIVNDKGKECSYHNFSGAERKNIDLACLFTFMDIRKSQGDVSYNLIMFDELLDSSLDEKGVELVLDLLTERVDDYNECIYVISHRKESVKSCTGEVVTLEKSNGITRRK